MHRPRPAHRRGPDPHDLRRRAEPHPAVGAPEGVPARQPRRPQDRPRRAGMTHAGMKRASFVDIDRGPRRTAISIATVVAALAIGAVAIALLEAAGVPNASSAYLLAVVGVAVLRGTVPAIATAIGAFLAYDFFFTEPLYTFTVRNPEEWLNLLLLLVVGIVVGRLAGASRARAEAAIEGERSARAMFNVSFTMSTRKDTPSALRPIADIVRDETMAERVWIVVGDSLQADTAWQDGPPDAPPVYEVLRRQPGDAPAEWVRLHAAHVRTGRGS